MTGVVAALTLGAFLPEAGKRQYAPRASVSLPTPKTTSSWRARLRPTSCSSQPQYTAPRRRHSSTALRLCSVAPALSLDPGHVSLLVSLASSRSKVVQSVDLTGAQLDAVGRDVLLDAGHVLGTRNWGDVVALR